MKYAGIVVLIMSFYSLLMSLHRMGSPDPLEQSLGGVLGVVISIVFIVLSFSVINGSRISARIIGAIMIINILLGINSYRKIEQEIKTIKYLSDTFDFLDYERWRQGVLSKQRATDVEMIYKMEYAKWQGRSDFIPQTANMNAKQFFRQMDQQQTLILNQEPADLIFDRMQKDCQKYNKAKIYMVFNLVSTVFLAVCMFLL